MRDIQIAAAQFEARRSDLYSKLVEPLPPSQRPVVNPGWPLRDLK
jgi:hypothetical protein